MNRKLWLLCAGVALSFTVLYSGYTNAGTIFLPNFIDNVNQDKASTFGKRQETSTAGVPKQNNIKDDSQCSSFRGTDGEVLVSKANIPYGQECQAYFKSPTGVTCYGNCKCANKFQYDADNCKDTHVLGPDQCYGRSRSEPGTSEARSTTCICNEEIFGEMIGSGECKYPDNRQDGNECVDKSPQKAKHYKLCYPDECFYYDDTTVYGTLFENEAVSNVEASDLSQAKCSWGCEKDLGTVNGTDCTMCNSKKADKSLCYADNCALVEDKDTSNTGCDALYTYCDDKCKSKCDYDACTGYDVKISGDTCPGNHYCGGSPCTTHPNGCEFVLKTGASKPTKAGVFFKCNEDRSAYNDSCPTKDSTKADCTTKDICGKNFYLCTAGKNECQKAGYTLTAKYNGDINGTYESCSSSCATNGGTTYKCTPKDCGEYTYTTCPTNAVCQSCIKGCNNNTPMYKPTGCKVGYVLVGDY